MSPPIPGQVVVLERDPARRRRLISALSGIDGEVVVAADLAEAHERLPASAVVAGGIDPAPLEAAYPDVPIIGAEGPTEAVAARVDAARAKRRSRAAEDAVEAVAGTLTGPEVAVVGAAGKVRWVTEGFAVLVGRDPGALAGTPIDALYEGSVPDPDADRWRGRLALAASGERIEREHEVVRREDGRVVCVHPDPGPARRTEHRRSHRILESALAELPLSIYAKDRAARHVRASANQVEPPIETPDGDLVADPAGMLGRTDRELFDADLSAGSYADDRRVIEEGETIEGKVERYDVRLGEQRWTETSKAPWTDLEGRIRGLVGVTTEITSEVEHRRESERRRQRLEEFASMVAHDLRNPLNVARGNLELARDSGAKEPLADVERSLDRMERLIDDFLLLAREGADGLEPTEISLRAVAEAAWEPVAGQDAAIRIERDCRIVADRGRTRQLLVNLFRNAVEHAGEDVTVTVEATPEDFAIEDDGPGFPKDRRDRVLEAGYTTSPEGTGFGLRIVKRIAAAHGWEVAVEEGEAGGARVVIEGVEAP